MFTYNTNRNDKKTLQKIWKFAKQQISTLSVFAKEAVSQLTHNEVPHKQAVNGLSDLRLGLHFELVVLPSSSFGNSQLELRLISKTCSKKASFGLLNNGSDRVINSKNENTKVCHV